ncbi:MAG: SHOCT domain-containing protein [Candidatus Longimicrobiales bacterium M2_2A_002]
MTLAYLLLQQGEPWHRQGLYMGMHWAWWLFWIAAFIVLGWAFWRLFAERREARTGTRQMVEAEELLRQRFARGEIDEDELLKRMRALHAARVPGPERTETELSKGE